MKKAISILLAAILVFCLAACSKSGNDTPPPVTNQGAEADPSRVDVDVKEGNYVSFINEIYTNTSDYVGKNIRIQGMFSSETVEQTGNSYYYVYRVGPGCCGNDGSMCGFEFTWDKMDTLKENDWLEVIGELETYQEGDNTYLNLKASSVKVMDTRGAETVGA